MARGALSATINTASKDFAPDIKPAAEPNAKLTTLNTDVAALVAAKVDTTTVDAAVAVLVADGASPTQAHVNTLNTAWTTLKANCATLNTAVDTVNTDNTPLAATVSADLTLLFNASNISTKNAFLVAIRALTDRLLNGTSWFT
jgi:hypothetical protein